MQMTKQRKMLVGVLCVGLGALALDRLVLAPPDSASADQAQPAPTDADAAGPTGALLSRQANEPEQQQNNDTASLPSYASLTERLVAYQSAQTAQAQQANDTPTPDAAQDPSDPFAVPNDWAPRAPRPSAPTPAQTRDAAGQAGQAFLARHRLAATLNDAGKQRAVVDGRLMMIGDELDGYKLIQINPRWVIWESLDGKHAVVMHTERGPS